MRWHQPPSISHSTTCATFNVCAACCRGTETHYCDGTSRYQSWEDVTSNHLSTPLYVFPPQTHNKHILTLHFRLTTNHLNSSLHHHLSGPPAYQLLHGAITEYPLVLNEDYAVDVLLKPVLDHAVKHLVHEECTYSAGPKITLQGIGGFWGTFSSGAAMAGMSMGCVGRFR
jgi:hypothetical protein